MSENGKTTTLKRLQNRYRLVIMNDDTYEEVITFRLSRWSVYVGLSSIFVLTRHASILQVPLFKKETGKDTFSLTISFDLLYYI